MVTVKDIEAKIAKLQAQAEAIMSKETSAAVAKIRDLMQRHGLTVADLDAGAAKQRGRKAGGTKSAKKSAAMVKYRDPKTGAGWTGHGRAPAWIANAKNRDRFLVSEAAAGAVKKTQAKAGNYVRGPQPAKYRDPESGVTWSGRGKAPAWLASAKDRTAYLIDK